MTYKIIADVIAAAAFSCGIYFLIQTLILCAAALVANRNVDLTFNILIASASFGIVFYHLLTRL